MNCDGCGAVIEAQGSHMCVNGRIRPGSRLPADDADVAIDLLPHKVRTSPWAQRAFECALPYKVYADLSTDKRTVMTRETVADILRRTLPPTRGG